MNDSVGEMRVPFLFLPGQGSRVTVTAWYIQQYSRIAQKSSVAAFSKNGASFIIA